MTSRWTRWSGWSIAFVGGGLAAFLFVDAVATPNPVYWGVESYPIALSLVLLVAGVLLARGRLIADRFLGRLLAWTAIGVVLLSILTVYLFSLLTVVARYEPLDTPVGIITTLTFGALVGLLVGIYDARLQEQSRAIERLSHVTNTLRIATGELVAKTDRVGLERAVCTRLAEADAYDGAWIGRYESDGSERPVAWAGIDDAFVESLAEFAPRAPTERGVLGSAVETRDVQFVSDPLTNGTSESPRGDSSDDGRRAESIAVVPLVGADGVHGRLGVVVRDRVAFEELEREVFTELGETIGRAIDSIRAHERLERRERELVVNNHRLDRFASVVSHDLRNPLNVILGRVALLQERDDEESLDSIARAGRRMEEIIADLLALSRAGRTVDAWESVELASVARTSWANVETSVNELELHVSDAATIRADRTRLMNVFENLFRNAIDHNDPPVTVRVGVLEPEVAAGDGESLVGFFVEDDGRGIPVDARDEVFDHGYTTDRDGTGLGLSIVKEVVEAHDWSISVVESALGGTRFEVQRPDIDADA